MQKLMSLCKWGGSARQYATSLTFSKISKGLINWGVICPLSKPNDTFITSDPNENPSLNL